MRLEYILKSGQGYLVNSSTNEMICCSEEVAFSVAEKMTKGGAISTARSMQEKGLAVEIILVDWQDAEQ